jgi:signal transduction histidine kinase
VTDPGTTNRLAYLNRLLAGSDGWATPAAMLADFCTAFGARAAGLRWPAEGPAVVIAETNRVSSPTFQHRFALPDGSVGLFWVDGSDDAGFWTLAANALGRSPAMTRFLGPAADQTRVAQRLDDAGKAARRVAHDLGNVFQAVGGFLSLALDMIEKDSAALSSLTEAESASKMIAVFCDQLHQLHKSGEAKPGATSVATAITREANRVAKANPKIKVEIDIAADLPPIAIDAGGVQQIVGHLIDNAAEAVPAEGPVQVSARLIELAPGDLAGYLGNPAPGPNVEIMIRDAGPGMTEDARRRVFVEPFFTTKARHRGLGLAVVYRSLYAHRGGVRVEHGPGRGTTVTVVVPLAGARRPALESGRTTGGSL